MSNKCSYIDMFSLYVDCSTTTARYSRVTNPYLEPAQ